MKIAKVERQCRASCVALSVFVAACLELGVATHVNAGTHQFGQEGDIPLPADYDGDGFADLAVWRPSTGEWFIMQSDGSTRAQQWGEGASQIILFQDVPVPADYDRDGRADIAVWRPKTGVWWIIQSSDGKVRTQQWGAPFDVPVQGDYDADEKADLAVWRPSTGEWWIIQSSDGAQRTQQFGQAGDKPMPGRWDPDPGADFAVWRPKDGTLFTLGSKSGRVDTINTTNPDYAYSAAIPLRLRSCEGRDAVSLWFPPDPDELVLWHASTGVWQEGYWFRPTPQWGKFGDVPVPAPYQGRHNTDQYAVFRPSNGTWYIRDEVHSCHEGE